MEGLKVKTTSLYDGEAREVIHVKHVSDLLSKVSACLDVYCHFILSDSKAQSFYFFHFCRFCTGRNGMRPRIGTCFLLMPLNWFLL